MQSKDKILSRRTLLRIAGGIALTASATGAYAAATGFVSTAAETAKFFGAGAGKLRKSADTRREMTRPHWRIPHIAAEWSYV